MAELAEKLYRSRVKHPDGRVTYEGPVADLMRQVELLALEQELNFSRWETGSKLNARIRHITYALHTGERRERFGRIPKENVLRVEYMEGLESNGSECQAYRALHRLRQFLLHRAAVNEEQAEAVAAD